MKKIFYLLILCCLLPELKAQIICGDTSGAVNYFNFVPDITVTDSTKVDLDNDSIPDIVMVSYASGSMYHVDGWNITALNPNLEFCVRSNSLLYVDSISLDSIIDGQRTWLNGSFRLTRYESYPVGNPPIFTQVYAGYYWPPLDHYMGVRFNNPGDTLYGWILWGNGHSVIKSYAFQSSTVSTGQSQLPGSSVTLFPNPCSNNITIETNFENDLREIKLFDISGKLLMVKNSYGKTAELNVADVPNGIYFVKVLTLQGTLTKRVVILK